MSAKKNLKVIVGLGPTGQACLRYLKRRGEFVAGTDSRDNPPSFAPFKNEFPDIVLKVGGFSTSLIHQAQELIVSPGVSLKNPLITNRISQGISVIGDIELFVREARAPIIAITGSNGKSTVTALVGEMINQAGYKAYVCGNIGQQVLELLDKPVPDFYVMELSSFQLETTYSLQARVAVVLNVSPDHMDRYANYSEYIVAKRRIYLGCHQAVINIDEPEIWRKLNEIKIFIGFTLNEPQENEFGLRNKNDVCYLAFGKQYLLPINHLKLTGRHNVQNVLAALAIGKALDLPMERVLSALQNFTGLPHRCQWVARKREVDWYNDSKATNLGAAIAAITSIGLEKKGNLILIAGGDAKEADLRPLRDVVEKYVSHVILLGKDAAQIAKILVGCAEIIHEQSLPAAVECAAGLAKAADTVLLAPACASYDMFNNFEHRGEVFIQAVNQLP